MEVENLVCFSCKHFDRNEGGCAAFPDEIPEEITSGKNKHETPLKDQGNKIVYERETD